MTIIAMIVRFIHSCYHDSIFGLPVRSVSNLDTVDGVDRINGVIPTVKDGAPKSPVV